MPEIKRRGSEEGLLAFWTGLNRPANPEPEDPFSGYIKVYNVGGTFAWPPIIGDTTLPYTLEQTFATRHPEPTKNIDVLYRVTQAVLASTAQSAESLMAGTTVQPGGWPASQNAAAQLLALSQEIAKLQAQVAALHSLRWATATITTLTPSPFKVLRDIPVLVREVAPDEYTATFADAGISASGETLEEAIANLRDLLSTTFEVLSGKPAEALGPGPARQLAILRTVMQ